MDKEQAIKSEISQALEIYKSIEDVLSSKFDELREKQGLLPKKFTAKDDDYENHLINASQLKHEAIELWRDSLASYEEINSDCGYYSAQFRLYLAESFLQEHGFDRITDSLREAFVNSDKTMTELFKLKGRLEALSGASERLVRAFESDETNCRKLLERMTKLTGL